MFNQNTPYPRMAIALLALLGMFDSAYLWIERLSGGELICPVGGGCATVQSSSYATLLGVPVAAIGVGGYAALLGVALLALHTEQLAGLPTRALLLIMASGGVLFSLYLTYLQVAIIGAICFWCVTSALIEFSIWLIALLDWRASSRKPAIDSPPASGL